MEQQPMIIEGYDDYNTLNYSNLFDNNNNNQNQNNNMNINNLLNNLGEYIENDLENKEEPFLRNVLEKYNKNLEELYKKVDIDNINDLVKKYIKTNKKIDINYENSFLDQTEKLKEEFNVNFSITRDITNLKKLLKETIDEMLVLENKLIELMNKYEKNKDTILKVQDTYKNDNNKDLLKEFEKIFDKLNNNFIEENEIEIKLKKYIDIGIKLNILIKVSNDIKSLINGPNSCSICLNYQINKVVIPCGHTFCDKCLKKNENYYRNNNRISCCPICRKNIVNENNIFLV